MSKFAPNVRELKRYLMAQTGRPGNNFSSRGFVGPKRDDGYHLGKSDIYGPGGRGDKDYSIQRPRDKRGLTDFASAIDITLPVPAMKRLTAWLEAQAKAGKIDLMEFLGPGPDGRAYWWDKRRKWEPVRLTKGNSHEWHVHVSFPRDRIPGDDLIPEWEPFFGVRPEPLPPDDDDGPEPPAEEPPDTRSELDALRDEYEAKTKLVQTVLNSAGATLVVDGIFGPKTEAALRSLPERVAAFAAYMADTEALLAGIEKPVAEFRHKHGGK